MRLPWSPESLLGFFPYKACFVEGKRTGSSVGIEPHILLFSSTVCTLFMPLVAWCGNSDKRSAHISVVLKTPVRVVSCKALERVNNCHLQYEIGDWRGRACARNNKQSLRWDTEYDVSHCAVSRFRPPILDPSIFTAPSLAHFFP